jgi:hypothetical protein
MLLAYAYTGVKTVSADLVGVKYPVVSSFGVLLSKFIAIMEEKRGACGER